MKWSLYRWVWRLDAPLFIGLPPAGSLNRCRLYVPARALWGGVTAELARSRSQQFPDYAQVGADVSQQVRFTYLFPAADCGGEWRAWLPRYETGCGLVWHLEDGSHNCVAERRFRAWLLDARPGTAIEPDSDTAAEGSLRETECVLPHWRGGEHTGQPVGLIGYVLVAANGSLTKEIYSVKVLFLGGDTRYGLGRVQRIKCNEASTIFGKDVDLTQSDPIIRSDVVYAHGVADHNSSEMNGAREDVVRWDRTAQEALSQLGKAPLWTPGSHLRGGGPVPWCITKKGTWRPVPAIDQDGGQSVAEAPSESHTP